MKQSPPRVAGESPFRIVIARNFARCVGKALQIQVNGEPREVDETTSLSELVTSLSLKAEQVAIELNRQVVRRARWETTLLNAHDKVEIVHFVGGGCNANC